MKRFSAVMLVISMIFCFTACSDNSKDEYPVKIASYTFNEKPDSVVCLSDSVADILIACGYADNIDARSDECTQDEISALPSVGTKVKPNTKKISELSPDVVFADKSLDESVAKKLKSENITVLTMVSARTTDELTMLYENICSVMDGKITGRENGKNKANAISLAMDDLQRLVPEKDVVATACYLYDTDGTAATENTLCGKLFSYANMVNVCSHEMSGNSMLNALKISNPQYIFCDTGVKERILSDKFFKNFTAVKKKHIYEIDSSVFERQGNSITQVLSDIIEIVYPELSSSSQNSKAETSDKNSAENSKTTNENSKTTVENSKPSNENSETSIENSETSDENSENSVENSEISDENSTQSTVEADDSLEITDDMQYQNGEDDDNIKIIQNRLVDLGYMDENATGYYGNVTEEAVKNFEENNNLTVDGIADSKDLKLLFSADVKPA
ncbi:MAG: ABC transporter substrate-binding protein [Clostridia bacterium]|nr:ABC transporter substrate-binding protein [Clostridia bacterium]